MKIYTRKGDDGSTSLWYGGRVPKSHPRTEAYGTLDEANSALGLARAVCADAELSADILRLQSELFVAGAELATAPEAHGRLEAGVSRLDPAMVDWLEERIDAYMSRVELPPQFVIPGGNDLSARLDLARTILRRAERRVVELQQDGELERLGRRGLRQPRVRSGVRDGTRDRRGRPGAVRRAPRLEQGPVVKVSSVRVDGFTQEAANGRGHKLIVDEPAEVGGHDRGPRPTELLAISLASCTAITVEMYAERKGIELSNLSVDVHYDLDPRAGHSSFSVMLNLPPGLSEEQVERLRVIAGKCPVHRVLAGDIEITDRVAAAARLEHTGERWRASSKRGC